FWLTWHITATPAASAPATIASACSSVITLNAQTPRPSARAASTMTLVETSAISSPFLFQHTDPHHQAQPRVQLQVNLTRHRPGHRRRRQRHRLTNPPNPRPNLQSITPVQLVTHVQPVTPAQPVVPTRATVAPRPLASGHAPASSPGPASGHGLVSGHGPVS